MSGYAKLFADIVDSSIWSEPNPVRVVWITMLALADSDGYIRGSPGWLASKAKVSLAECNDALKRFQAPDPASRTPDHEGRRIEALEDGWIILNYMAFRDRLSQDAKASATRERVRKYRERHNALRNAPSVTRADSASASASVTGIHAVEGGCKGETTKARPSTPEEVVPYVRELGMPEVEAHKFFDHFSANGWKIGGKAPMKDWKSAVRNWHRNWQERQKPHGQCTPSHGVPDADDPLFGGMLGPDGKPA